MFFEIGKLCARKKKFPLLQPGSVFKDYVHRVKTLEKSFKTWTAFP